MDSRHKLWAAVVIAAAILYFFSNRYQFFGTGGLWFRGDRITGSTQQISP